MKLLAYPHRILLRKADAVPFGNDEAVAILDEMATKMYEWNGVGLAAPQIGLSKKMIVIDIREPAILYKMINPEIIDKSEKMIESMEGCLSLPLVTAPVARHECVTVQYYDCSYNKCTIDANGLLAICLQHEIDHLDGKLYIHELSKYKRYKLVKKSRQLQMSLKNETAQKISKPA